MKFSELFIAYLHAYFYNKLNMNVKNEMLKSYEGNH